MVLSSSNQLVYHPFALYEFAHLVDQLTPIQMRGDEGNKIQRGRVKRFYLKSHLCLCVMRLLLPYQTISDCWKHRSIGILDLQHDTTYTQTQYWFWMHSLHYSLLLPAFASDRHRWNRDWSVGWSFSSYFCFLSDPEFGNCLHALPQYIPFSYDILYHRVLVHLNLCHRRLLYVVMVVVGVRFVHAVDIYLHYKNFFHYTDKI